MVVAGAAVSWAELSTGSAPRVTLAEWIDTRGKAYLIGHRGSGDVRPEHSMQAYEAAYRWGAKALEISTSSTSDGVLICMHDLTYNRTTDATGVIHDMPSSALRKIGIRIPQLGPAWTREPLPKVPLLEEALKRFGGRMVLCIEPKLDADYDAVITLVEKYRLTDSVIVKLFHTSSNIARAQRAGYPVFAYLGSNDVSVKSISELAEQLNRKKDYLVLPSRRNSEEEYLPAPLVEAAVDTGLAVWVFPVHRRSEAAKYFSQGVSGVISSSVGYSRHVTAPVHSDAWASGAIASGEITRDPANDAYQLGWPGGGVLSLAAKDRQHFVTLGQFAPVQHAAGSYQIAFDARWDSLPADPGAGVSLALGHADDRYYEQGLGSSTGYHADLRADGSLNLYRHLAGSHAEAALTKTVMTPPARAGEWMSFRLAITPTTLTWQRLDHGAQASVSAVDAQSRGGYFHLGRTSPDGALSLRRLRLS